MTDDTTMAADFVGGVSEVGKGSVRRGAGSGVKLRARPAPRRSWSAEDKRRIVGETLEPGVVAARPGIGTGLLFTWRREMLATAMSGFAAVAIVPGPAAVALARADVAPGLIEVAFPSGTTLRICFNGLDGIAATARGLLLDANRGLAFVVDTSSAKEFALAHWLVGGTDGGRIFIRVFDAP